MLFIVRHFDTMNWAMRVLICIPSHVAQQSQGTALPGGGVVLDDECRYITRPTHPSNNRDWCCLDLVQWHGIGSICVGRPNSLLHDPVSLSYVDDFRTLLTLVLKKYVHTRENVCYIP